MVAVRSNLAVRAVQPVIAGLAALGHDVDALLDRVHLRRSRLDDADGTVPHPTMMELWRIAAELSGDENLGIHVAEAAPLDAFGLHAYVVLASPTLREAYRRGSRYQRLIHDATDLVFEEGPEFGVLRHSLPGGVAVPRQPAEFLATVWIRLGRSVSGSEWDAPVVCFAHPEPPDCREHARLFGGELRFASGRTALQVPNAVLDLPNPRGDRGLVGVLDDYAASLLERVPERPSVAARVRANLVAALQSGEVPTAAEVASHLNIGVRSLYRGLRGEGTTFREVVDRLRHERSCELLANTRYGIAEVAFLLGFAELSSFYRAFKRWSGVTPAEYREGSRLSRG